MKTLILLSFILICAPQLFAQPPAIRRPVPTTVTPTPVPASIRPVGLPGATLKNGRDAKPDLLIKTIKYSVKECAFYVNVANQGISDAGKFNVWVDLTGFRKDVLTSDGISAGKDQWLSTSAIQPKRISDIPGLTPHPCLLASIVKIRAVADPRYSSRYLINFLEFGELLAPSQIAPADFKVSEPMIAESNENNNELTVDKGSIGLYP